MSIAVSRSPQDALRTLSGKDLDGIEADKGSIAKCTQKMKEALRRVDEGGCFKLSALEEAFLERDNKHRSRFSVAAGESPEEWAKGARESMRAVLSRTNKAKLQQQKRDDKKRKQTEPVAPPAEVLTSTHSSKKRGVNKIASEEQDAKEQPIKLIPGYRGPMEVATIVCMLDVFPFSFSLALNPIF